MLPSSSDDLADLRREHVVDAEAARQRPRVILWRQAEARREHPGLRGVVVSAPRVQHAEEGAGRLLDEVADGGGVTRGRVPVPRRSPALGRNPIALEPEVAAEKAEHRLQPLGIAAVLDHEPVAAGAGQVQRAVVVEEARRDGRAARRRRRRRRRRVVDHGDRVAVDEEAATDVRLARLRHPDVVLRAEEEVRRVHRAGAEEHAPGPHRGLLVAGSVIVVRHGVGVVSVVAADVQDLRERPDVGAELLGHGQVVQVERVLGVELAAGDALPAHHASVEVDGQRRQEEPGLASERARRALHRHHLRQWGRHESLGDERRRDRPDPEHGGDDVVVRVERPAGVDRGPAVRVRTVSRGGRERGLGRTKVHVGVAERAPAISRHLDGERALEVLHVPEPVIERPRPSGGVRQVVGPCGGPREVAPVVATAALQDADVLPGLGETAGGHGTAEAGADDDGIEQ